jgi:cell division septation protein DedD
MNKYFIQLFKEESTVILPGFGALTMTNERSGEIMFMPYLKFDDGKLAAYISETDAIEVQAAQIMIAKFIREIQAELDKGESFDIFEFGSFTKKEDGEIEFTSDLSMGQGGKSTSEKAPVAAVIPETPYVEPIIKETPIVEPFTEYTAPIDEAYVAPDYIPEPKAFVEEGEVHGDDQNESAIQSDEDEVKDKKDKKKDKKKEKKAQKKAKKSADSKDLINSILSGENLDDQSDEENQSEDLGVIDGTDQLREITEEIKEVTDEPKAVEAKIDDLEHAKGDIVEEEIAAALSEKGQTSKIDKKALKKEKKEKKAAIVTEAPDGEEPIKKKRKRGLGFWLLLTFLIALLGGIAWVGMNFDQVKPHIPFLAEKKEPYISPADTSETIKILKELSKKEEETIDEEEEPTDSLTNERTDSPEKAKEEAKKKAEIVVLKTKETVQKKEPLKKEVKTISKAAAPLIGSYHVVVGSFGEQKNAQKLVNELKSKGYKAVLAGTNPTGLLVVSAGLTPNREEALVLLEKVKPLHSGAWLKKN